MPRKSSPETSNGWGMPKPEWKKRRRLLYLALGFIAGWLSFIFFKGTDSVLYQQAAFALIGGGVVLIGQYVFGAAWDDRNYMNAVSRMRRRPAEDSSDDDTSDTDRPISAGS